MEKLLTIELGGKDQIVEMHLNKLGSEYLRDILSKLIAENQNCDHHLMTPDWGGNELTSDQQNLKEGSKLIHNLKLFYWKE